jgi:PPOX class probable F420-dependent enzyme
MAADSPLLALGSEDFVSLTTFRKTGEAVPTTVWIGRDGDALLVTTPRGTGKVKRIRNNPEVELSPSNRMGHVRDGAPVVKARAEILEDFETAARLATIFRRKYGLQWRIAMWLEGLRKKKATVRVVLRLTS